MSNKCCTITPTILITKLICDFTICIVMYCTIIHFHYNVGSLAIHKVEKVLCNKRILKDVEKLSHHFQSSSLEAFHSLILRFTPKHVVFPFMGMLCRYYRFEKLLLNIL